MTGRQKPAFPMFPATRLRRSRARDFSRRLARETRLSPADFILPVFVLDDPDGRQPVESMPGVERVGHNGLFALAERCLALGIPRSEEHTSELQSRGHLVCRLLLEKKK